MDSDRSSVATGSGEGSSTAPGSQGAPDSSDGDDSSFPDCPHCGEPVVFSVVTGPDTGSVAPCGCSVPPELLVGLRE